MKIYKIVILVSIFILSGCGNKRENWDPTPVISSVKIIKTACKPYETINYSNPLLNTDCPDYLDNVNKSEWWVVLRIDGSGFSDEYGYVSEIDVLKNNDPNKDLGCNPNSNGPNIMECTVNSIDVPTWGGAGTYYVRIKRAKSDWSNSLPFVVN